MLILPASRFEEPVEAMGQASALRLTHAARVMGAVDDPTVPAGSRIGVSDGAASYINPLGLERRLFHPFCTLYTHNQ